MGRFYKAEDFEGNTQLYQAPIELMNKAAEFQASQADAQLTEAAKNISLLQQKRNEVLEWEKPYYDKEIEKYNTQYNTVVDNIYKNAFDWKKQVPVMKQVGVDLASNISSGNIGSMVKNYATRTEWEKELDKANPIQKKALLQAKDISHKDFYSKLGDSDYQKNAYSTEDAAKWVDVSKTLDDWASKMKASGLKVKRASTGGGYIVENTKSGKSVNYANLTDMMNSSVLGDPDTMALLKQGIQYGYLDLNTVNKAIEGAAKRYTYSESENLTDIKSDDTQMKREGWQHDDQKANLDRLHEEKMLGLKNQYAKDQAQFEYNLENGVQELKATPEGLTANGIADLAHANNLTEKADEFKSNLQELQSLEKLTKLSDAQKERKAQLKVQTDNQRAFFNKFRESILPATPEQYKVLKELALKVAPKDSSINEFDLPKQLENLIENYENLSTQDQDKFDKLAKENPSFGKLFESGFFAKHGPKARQYGLTESEMNRTFGVNIDYDELQKRTDNFRNNEVTNSRLALTRTQTDMITPMLKLDVTGSDYKMYTADHREIDNDDTSIEDRLKSGVTTVGTDGSIQTVYSDGSYMITKPSNTTKAFLQLAAKNPESLGIKQDEMTNTFLANASGKSNSYEVKRTFEQAISLGVPQKIIQGGFEFQINPLGTGGASIEVKSGGKFKPISNTTYTQYDGDGIDAVINNFINSNK